MRSVLHDWTRRRRAHLRGSGGGTRSRTYIRMHSNTHAHRHALTTRTRSHASRTQRNPHARTHARTHIRTHFFQILNARRGIPTRMHTRTYARTHARIFFSNNERNKIKVVSSHEFHEHDQYGKIIFSHIPVE